MALIASGWAKSGWARAVMPASEQTSGGQTVRQWHTTHRRRLALLTELLACCTERSLLRPQSVPFAEGRRTLQRLHISTYRRT